MSGKHATGFCFGTGCRLDDKYLTIKWLVCVARRLSGCEILYGRCCLIECSADLSGGGHLNAALPTLFRQPTGGGCICIFVSVSAQYGASGQRANGKRNESFLFLCFASEGDGNTSRVYASVHRYASTGFQSHRYSTHTFSGNVLSFSVFAINVWRPHSLTHSPTDH